MTNIYLLTPEIKAIIPELGKQGLEGELLEYHLEIEMMEPPFLAISGSGDKHELTLSFLENVLNDSDRDIAYVHLDAHRDWGYTYSLVMTPKDRILKRLLKRIQGFMPGDEMYLNNGSFVRAIAAKVSQVIVLGAQDRTVEDMDILRHLLPKIDCYTAPGEKYFSELYFNCTWQDLEMLRANRSVREIQRLSIDNVTELIEHRQNHSSYSKEEARRIKARINGSRLVFAVYRHDTDYFQREMERTRGRIIAADDIYASIDLDVLRRPAFTDYLDCEKTDEGNKQTIRHNHGELNMRQLKELLDYLLKYKNLVSSDICGVSASFARNETDPTSGVSRKVAAKVTAYYGNRLLERECVRENN